LNAMRMNKLPGYVMGLCLFAPLFLMPSHRCQGYVLPAHQLIDYMIKNFSDFKTLVITQTTWQQEERYEEKWESFQEKIWMESPNLFYVQNLNPSKERLMEPDTSYRSLLMANSNARVTGLLTSMGINLNAVGLERVEGSAVYRIGGKDPDVPKLLIEKERFLPLVLTYSFQGYSDTDTVTVLFGDYRKIDKGWYPFEITYFDPRGFRENGMIDTFQANVPIDPAVFADLDTNVVPDQTPEQDVVSPEEEAPENQVDSPVHAID
jgi:hypothetical protein